MDTLLIVWVMCAIGSTLVGMMKGRAGIGFVLGLALGLLGLFITICIPENKVDAR